MTLQLSGIEVLAERLLNEVGAGKPVQIEISAKDVASGSLLMLLLAIHEVAERRQLEVLVSQPAGNTLRLSLPGALEGS